MKFRNIAWFSLGPIASALLSFVVVPLSTWIFSKDDIGRIALLISVSGFTTVFLGFGMDQAYVREYHEEKEKHLLFLNSSIPGLIIGLLILLLLSILYPFGISQWIFGVDSILISVFIGVYFIVLFFSRFLSLTLRMEEKGLNYSISQILPKISFTLSIILVWLYVFEKSYIHLFLAHSIALLITILYLTYCNKALFRGFQGKISLDFVKVKQLSKFGFPIALSGMLFWGLEGVDKLMLKYYSSFEELGVYSVTLSVAAIVGVFTNIFTTIWVPVVYKWIAEKVNLKKIDQVISHILIGGIVFVSVTGIFSWVLNFILPIEYDNINYMLPLCMLWPVFYAISEASGIGIAVSRKTKYALLIAFLSLAINIILNMLLIPRLGASGAAISLAGTFWIFLILRTEASSRLWRKYNRIALYFWTGIIYCLGVLFALFGQDFKLVFASLWVLLIVIIVIVYKSYFKRYINYTQVIFQKIRVKVKA